MTAGSPGPSTAIWCSAPTAGSARPPSRSGTRPGSAAPAEPSVGARALEHGGGGLPQDLQVERVRPVLHVADVEPDGLVVGQVGTAADLPQAGGAGLDLVPALHLVPYFSTSAGSAGLGPTSDISPR